MDTPTVVAGYEGRPQSRDALALARLMAGALGASVLAVWSPDRDEPFSASMHESLRGRIRTARELRAEAGSVLDGGPEWDLTIQPALWPSDGLAVVAAEQAARALVVGSSHLGPVGRVVIGSTAARLLHSAPCPVAVAPRGWAGSDRPSVAAIGVAGDRLLPLARAFGARLVEVSADALSERSHDVDLLMVERGSVTGRLLQTTACPLVAA